MFLCLKCKEVLENEKCLLINFSDEMRGDEGGVRWEQSVCKSSRAIAN